jgi:excisionase family DNA binding protein
MSNKILLLTVMETAKILRIQRAKVYLLIESGSLQAVKIGAAWRVRRDSLEELVGPLTFEFATDPSDDDEHEISIQ